MEGSLRFLEPSMIKTSLNFKGGGRMIIFARKDEVYTSNIRKKTHQNFNDQ